MMQDRGAHWLDCYRAATKNADDTMQAFRHFVGPSDSVKRLCTDGACEAAAEAKGLALIHIYEPTRPY